MEKEQTISTIDRLIEKLVTEGVSLGKHILMAIVIYVVGRFIVKLINRLVTNAMEKRKIDPAVRSFVGSTVNITLQALLILSVIGALGIQMTSFSALLVSARCSGIIARCGDIARLCGITRCLSTVLRRIGVTCDKHADKERKAQQNASEQNQFFPHDLSPAAISPHLHIYAYNLPPSPRCVKLFLCFPKADPII